MNLSFYSSLPNRHRLGCVELRAHKNVVAMLVWGSMVAVIVYVLWHFWLSSLPIRIPFPSREIVFFLGFVIGFAVCGYFYDQMIREFHRSVRQNIHEP